MLLATMSADSPVTHYSQCFLCIS